MGHSEALYRANNAVYNQYFYIINVEMVVIIDVSVAPFSLTDLFIDLKANWLAVGQVDCVG